MGLGIVIAMYDLLIVGKPTPPVGREYVFAFSVQ